MQTFQQLVMKLTSEALFTPTDTLYPHETTLITPYLNYGNKMIKFPHPVVSHDHTLQKGDEEEMENNIHQSDPSLLKTLELIEESEMRSKTRCMKPSPEIKLQHSEKIEFNASPIQENGKNISRKIFKTEERTRYDNTHEFPQSVHGLVRIKLENETFTYGTGIIIGLNMVLTAAHNVWDKDHQRKHSPKNVQFLAGINGKTLPFGTANIKRIYIPESYIQTSTDVIPKDDYALLVLDRALGTQTGYFGIDIVDKQLLKKQGELYVVGYPGRVGDQEYQKLIHSGCYFQYGMKGSPFFDEEEPDFINYEIITSEGQSGSGVYYHAKETDEYFVVGIHVLGRPGDNSFNSATWLTKERFKQIQQWIEMSHKSDEENLNLSHMNWKEKGIENKALDIFQKNSKIEVKKLNLSHSSIDCTAMMKISINAKWDSLVEINLAGNNIKDQGAAMLACNMMWGNLIQLNLSKNSIGDEGAAAIGRSAVWRKLEALFLEENKVGDKGATVIAGSTCWPNLKMLSLAGNQIKALGAISIGQNVSWKELRKLNLSRNDIGRKGGVGIGKNRVWVKLEELWLDFAKLDNEAAIAIGKNTCWENLRILSLIENLFDNLGGAGIATNTSWINLEILNLCNNKIGIEFNDNLIDGIEWSCMFGRNKSWKNLIRLDLSYTELNFHALNELANNKTWINLRELVLRGNEFGKAEAAILSKNAIWTDLQELDLQQNNIGELGAERLSKNISWTKLRILNLGLNGIGSEGAWELAKNQSWKHLQYLNLASNKISSRGAIFLGGNTTWTQLQELVLRYNGIEYEGAQGLGKNVTWTNLQILDLRVNGLGNRGAGHLSENKSWIKLKSLNLQQNNIADNGAEALSKNSSWSHLKTLYLTGNQITSRGAEYLRKKTTWTVVGLENQDFPKNSSCQVF